MKVVLKGYYLFEDEKSNAKEKKCPYASGYLSKNYRYDVRHFDIEEIALFGMVIITNVGELHAVKYLEEPTSHPFFVRKEQKENLEKAFKSASNRIM
jgi:hypothetical protein